MSYVVTINVEHRHPWFKNALKHVSDMIGKVSSSDEHGRKMREIWKKTHNSVIDIQSPSFVWTITFPTEQDYTWFVLRWS